MTPEQRREGVSLTQRERGPDSARPLQGAARARATASMTLANGTGHWGTERKGGEGPRGCGLRPEKLKHMQRTRRLQVEKKGPPWSAARSNGGTRQEAQVWLWGSEGEPTGLGP